MHKVYISPILHINPIPASLILEVLVSVALTAFSFPPLFLTLSHPPLLPLPLSLLALSHLPSPSPLSIYPADGDGARDKVFGLVTSIDLLSFICNKKQ